MRKIPNGRGRRKGYAQGNIADFCGDVRKARLDDAVAVTPLMWFPATEVHHHAAEPNDTIWAVVVCGSHDTADGPEFHCDMAVLGTVLDDMREWRPLVDTILLLKRPHDLTRHEAEGKRREIECGLMEDFTAVHTFDDQVDCLRFCARRWPGKKVEALLTALEAELYQ